MLTKVTKWLLFAITIELVVGGGRLVSWGPVSLRMIFFVIALIITALHILQGVRIKPLHLKLLFAFTAMLAIGLVIGFITNADKKFIWEDTKPLLFFYLLPFFSIAITREQDVFLIQRIIVNSSTAMGIIFLFILLLISTDVIHFLDFYKVTSQTEEFFYRGEYSFYYKGFVYLCIAFIFTHLLHIKNKGWILVILTIAILLTFTRGLIFALGLTYLSYFIKLKKFRHVLVMVTLCGAVLYFGKFFYSSISDSLYKFNADKHSNTSPNLSNKLLGDREFSDNERKRQVKEVVTAITPASVIWGHGFGTGVASRPIHMEITYLEIFHKQGLIGLCTWFFLFFYLARNFISHSSNPSPMAYAYFLSALFIFFQSLTNQYINNPIGMGMFLISVVCVDVLKKSPIQSDNRGDATA